MQDYVRVLYASVRWFGSFRVFLLCIKAAPNNLLSFLGETGGDRSGAMLALPWGVLKMYYRHQTGAMEANGKVDGRQGR